MNSSACILYVTRAIAGDSVFLRHDISGGGGEVGAGNATSQAQRLHQLPECRNISCVIQTAVWLYGYQVTTVCDHVTVAVM